MVLGLKFCTQVSETFSKYINALLHLGALLIFLVAVNLLQYLTRFQSWSETLYSLHLLLKCNSVIFLFKCQVCFSVIDPLPRCFTSVCLRLGRSNFIRGVGEVETWVWDFGIEFFSSSCCYLFSFSLFLSLFFLTASLSNSVFFFFCVASRERVK